MIEIVELGKECDLITKGTTPTTLGKNFTSDGVSFLRAQNVINSNVLINDDILFIDKYTHENELKRSRIYDGDVLITIAGTIGRTAIVKNISTPLNCNQAVAIIRLGTSKINKEYLCHFIASPFAQEQFAKGMVTATIPNLSLAQVRKLKIPLPPLPQQQKIANILDAADALRQKDKALLKKYDELTQALFLDMFGDPVSNPKGWEKVETIKYCTSIVPGRDKPKSFTGDTPWVTTNDLYHLSYTSGSKSKIGLSDGEISQVRAKVIPENSVIMTCVGDLGVITVNKVKMVVNQQLHAFICSDKLNSIFLMHSLSYQKPYMYKMASSTTVPYMNKTVCNNIPTIVPPTSLQNQFAERVQLIEQQKP